MRPYADRSGEFLTIRSADRLRTALLTGFALLAFAGNSLLCRQALRHTPIDPASFSTIRVATGAATLLSITWLRRRGASAVHGTWWSATLLFLYAVPFSFAYVGLGVGTGALILFGAVQGTMLAAAVFSGERPHAQEWWGIGIALSGLFYLVLPGLAAPSPRNCVLMVVAGVAWGAYSLAGRGAADPLSQTTGNFVRAVPLALGISAIAASRGSWSTRGALLAAASGALASGLGYVSWYAALRGLTKTGAASVQLSVPVLAATGGVLFLSEPVTFRLALSTILILGGVALALFGKR